MPASIDRTRLERYNERQAARQDERGSYPAQKPKDKK